MNYSVVVIHQLFLYFSLRTSWGLGQRVYALSYKGFGPYYTDIYLTDYR
jgi:hypothetical protein